MKIASQVALLGVLLLSAAEHARASPCQTAAGKALRSDADRATLWNWGWGGIYATSAAAHVGLAMWTDDEDRRVAYWTGAVKSSLGTLSQIVRPIRIGHPRPGCQRIASQLSDAAERERKRHSWVPRALSVAVNAVAFSYVLYKTDDWLLASTGAGVGMLVGEISIYTAPDLVRSNGHETQGLSLIPSVQADSLGLVLGGAF